MPKLEKQQVIVEGSSSSVQTPFLQPSFPTKLWGCGRYGGSTVTQETTTTARPLYPTTFLEEKIKRNNHIMIK